MIGTQVEPAKKSEDTRPKYQTPRIQPMSEREILNTFQVTQAMATWWVAGC
jgi:hypothetical protein